jgi:transcription elongation factor Elf1
MIKTRLGAIRYNNRADKIFENYKRNMKKIYLDIKHADELGTVHCIKCGAVMEDTEAEEVPMDCSYDVTCSKCGQEFNILGDWSK